MELTEKNLQKFQRRDLLNYSCNPCDNTSTPVNRWKKSKSHLYWTIVGCSFLALCIQHTARLFFLLGFHKTVYNHAPGPCRVLDTVVGGSEDIEMFSDGLALMSSGHHSNTSQPGCIYLIDLKHPYKPVKKLKFNEEFITSTFHPHGISVWEDAETGDITVFVISDHPKKNRVEKFLFDKSSETLHHMATISNNNIRSAHSIVAISKDSFYLTNTHHSQGPVDKTLEFLMMFSWGTLVFYNGSTDEATIQARAFGPSGLALSQDKRLLYLASYGNQQIWVFCRKYNEIQGVETLEFVMFYPVDTHMGNMFVDQLTGSLWLGAANSVAEVMAHDRDPDSPCGSRIFHIEADSQGKLGSLREVYANNGSEISCASEALVYIDTLLIGAPNKPPVLCNIKAF